MTFARASRMLSSSGSKGLLGVSDEFCEVAPPPSTNEANHLIQIRFIVLVCQEVNIATVNPEANAAHLNLANAYSDAGRLEEAREAGLIAVERHSTEFDPYGNLVLVHVALAELGAALSLSMEALEKFSDEAKAHGHVGLALFTAGRPIQAEPYFVQAVELDPEYADGRLGLGVVRMQQERYDEALEHL